MDRDGVQPIIKVFAETPTLDGYGQIDIGGGHDSDIGFHHLVAAHANELAVFEHAQKAGLGGKGQLADLVQKQGAFVGNLKIALALVYRTRERAFLMAK